MHDRDQHSSLLFELPIRTPQAAKEVGSVSLYNVTKSKYSKTYLTATAKLSVLLISVS